MLSTTVFFQTMSTACVTSQETTGQQVTLVNNVPLGAVVCREYIIYVLFLLFIDELLFLTDETNFVNQTFVYNKYFLDNSLKMYLT